MYSVLYIKSRTYSHLCDHPNVELPRFGPTLDIQKKLSRFSKPFELRRCPFAKYDRCSKRMSRVSPLRKQFSVWGIGEVLAATAAGQMQDTERSAHFKLIIPFHAVVQYQLQVHATLGWGGVPSDLISWLSQQC